MVVFPLEQATGDRLSRRGAAERKRRPCRPCRAHRGKQKNIGHLAHGVRRRVAETAKDPRVGVLCCWSRRRESNPHLQLGKLGFYH